MAWCYWYYLNQSREVTQQACFQLSFLSFGEKQATAIITSLTLIGTLPTFSSSAISKGIIIFQLFNFSISLLLADSLAQRGADILPNIKMKRILRRCLLFKDEMYRVALKAYIFNAILSRVMFPCKCNYL